MVNFMFYARMVSLRYEELMCKNQQHNNSFLASGDLSSADNLCKQFECRSGPPKCQT